MNKKNEYLILTNKHTNKKLVYYPVAKNANSSAKLFIIKHLNLENKFYFEKDEIPLFKKNQNNLSIEEEKYNLVNFIPSYTKFKKIEVDDKACIFRDPIDRFASSYRNRILFHKDENFYNHSVDQVLEKLENNMFENKHFLPQTYWLGENLNYFTIKAYIKNLDPFISGINNFFNRVIEFPRIQTGGKGFNFRLNIEQKNKIKKIYSSDYDLVNEFI